MIRKPPWPVFSHSSARSYLGSFSAVQHIERYIQGAPWLGSYSVVHCVRRLMGQRLYCSAADSGVWGERGNGDGSTPLRVTQQHHLASMAAWLFFIVISHHNLLPHIPLISLSAVNSSPHPGLATQSLNSSSQPLCLQGPVSLSRTVYGCHKTV